MSQVWVSPEDALDDATLAALGTAGSASGSSLWILAGAADEAASTAAAASPDQIVVYLCDAPDDAVWAHLGTAFDAIVPTTASAVQLLAHVRTQRQGRRSEPRARMLRLLAHDLNNPLTAIRLLSEVLGYEITGPEYREDIQSILEAADTAAALIESLGAYAKLHSPTRSIDAVLDIARVLTEAAKRPSLADGIQIVVPAQSLRVRGDGPALSQAVMDVVLTVKKLADTALPCHASARRDGDRVMLTASCTMHRAPDRPQLFSEEHGPGVLRDQRIAVTPTGLVHAAHAARSAGGDLHVEVEQKRLTVRMILPAEGV